jgi:serine protease Do
MKSKEQTTTQSELSASLQTTRCDIGTPPSNRTLRFIPQFKRSVTLAIALLVGTSFVMRPTTITAEETPVIPGARVAEELSQAFERVAENITPSVVTISTESSPKKRRSKKGRDPLREFFGDDFVDKMAPTPQRGLGTGVIVDESGHILTNNHVLGDADEVTVRLANEKTVKAKVVGTDPRTDLAVIKIKVREELAKPARLGDSDALKIGEWVVAAGASFGLDNTITAGIVSAKGRALSGGAQYEDFIQTDAAINPGNSGGPLVNLRGEVVGINTAIVSKSGGYMGIGFAIPINMAKQVLTSLISNGKVTRGWLGVGIQNLTEDLSESFNYSSTDGALVGHVDPDGPAKSAGFKQGDIIIKVESSRIKNVNQLRNLIASIKPNTRASILVVRNGKKLTRTVTIGELPSQTMETEQEPDGAVDDVGVTVEEFTSASPRKPRTERSSGIFISGIDPRGPAANAELQPGDVIISVDGKDVSSIDEFRDAISKGDLTKGLRFVVESRGMQRFAIVRDDNGDDDEDETQE